MMNLESELSNLKLREMNVSLSDLFPDVNLDSIREQFGHLKHKDPHETILNVAKELGEEGYSSILEQHGFWDQRYSQFGGHCHQCTPELGLVLLALGFKDVSYLECYRIREHFPETGDVEMMPPQEEKDVKMRETFVGIGRIPYCCLEVRIGDEAFYISGKHLISAEGWPIALLSPVCYRDVDSDVDRGFRHQDDGNKSGIYLGTIIPKKSPQGTDIFRKFVVWRKQTFKDPNPELFTAYLRMNLVE